MISFYRVPFIATHGLLLDGVDAKSGRLILQTVNFGETVGYAFFKSPEMAQIHVQNFHMAADGICGSQKFPSFIVPSIPLQGEKYSFILEKVALPECSRIAGMPITDTNLVMLDKFGDRDLWLDARIAVIKKRFSVCYAKILSYKPAEETENSPSGGQVKQATRPAGQPIPFAAPTPRTGG